MINSETIRADSVPSTISFCLVPLGCPHLLPGGASCPQYLPALPMSLGINVRYLPTVDTAPQGNALGPPSLRVLV